MILTPCNLGIGVLLRTTGSGFIISASAGEGGTQGGGLEGTWRKAAEGKRGRQQSSVPTFGCILEPTEENFYKSSESLGV